MVADVLSLAAIANSMAGEVATKILVAVHSQTLQRITSARGLKGELNSLKREFCKVQALLRAAERLCPELRNELVLHWLKHVKDVASFADNVLDEISYEELRRKVESKRSQAKSKISKFFSGSNPLGFRLRIAGKVGKVMLMIGEIYQEAQALGLRPVELSNHHAQEAVQPVLDDLRRYRENVDTSCVVGRKHDELQFVKALCNPSGNEDLSVLAIVGMSGIGKTTLAKRVYENKAVKKHFRERFWIFVSHDFDPIDILKEMVELITKRRCDLSGSDVIINMVRDCLKERRYLLVLDDVWNTNWQIWESMRSLLKRLGGSTASKIILTTRNIAVASTMEASLTHRLQVLDEDDSWTLFRQIAFVNKAPGKVSALEDIGRRIVGKCKGIPLAIKALAHVLKFKNDEREWESVESSEVWDLPGDGNRIMPSLLLSFNYLPDPSLKRCFAYCSVISQKGSLMGREMMIKTWMAQGFLRPQEGSSSTMEDVGLEYLNILLNNCLLQVDKYDWLGRAYYFSMHDLVHDLAVYVSKDTFSTVACISDVSKSKCSDTEHLYITGKRKDSDALTLPGENNLNKLRTVCSLSVVTSEFIGHARFLRVLMLINCGMEEVPISIGRLKHLRYLSLRRNPIKFLPESVTNLYNLQTLSLLQCTELIELPKLLGNMLNLRHISTSIHVTLPREIGQLSYLQTLPHLSLQAEGGQIGELGCLENIKGVVSVKGLEYVKCEEDAKKAGLDRKAGIDKLELIWGNETPTDTFNTVQEVMNGLLPHSNLKGLVVENYKGELFAPWLSSRDLMCSLVKLHLLACESCEELPTLGHLPSLQVVEIEGMVSLDVIGVNFFYFEEENEEGLSILFPALRVLRLQNLPNLKYWFEPTGKLAFPKLRELKILDCPQLTSAPTCLPSLEHLSIRGTRSGLPLVMILSNTTKLPCLAHLIIDTISELSFLPQGLAECTSLREIKILGCSKLAHLPSSLTDLHSLESIEVSQCCRLTSLPDIKGLSSLREMSIKHCKKLKHTPSGLESCTSLKTLRFTMCPSLKFVPDLSLLSCLGSLDFTLVGEQVLVPRWVTNMSNLDALSIGMFHKRLDSFPDISYLPRSLRRLCLNGWPEMEFLPVELQLFTQLRVLDIWHFGGLEALPEWMMNLSCLDHLVIRYCKKLKSLISLAAMKHLAKLRILDIQDCPLLEEQCFKGTGSEWHKIAHIPHVIINEEEIQKLA